ncbi:MAG: hypothetical protein V9F01_02815 [Chitinophagaceae bacterium]
MPSNEADDAARRVETMGRIVAGAGRPVDAAAAHRRRRAADRRAGGDPIDAALPSPADDGAHRRRPAIAPSASTTPTISTRSRAAGATLVRLDTLQDTQLAGHRRPVHRRRFPGNAGGRTRGQRHAAHPPQGGDRRRPSRLRRMRRARCISHASLAIGGRSYRMVGAIPGDVVMHERPVGRGYVELERTADFPWPATGDAGASVRAHEFHYSSLENLPADARYAYTVRRGHGVDGKRDGIVAGSVLGSYAHLRSAGGNDWAARFVAHVRASDYRRQRSDNVVWLPSQRGREAMVL